MQPLADVTVLDATQVVAGPFASMLLADLGAEVVKIERPDGGDIGRSNPPFVGGHSTYFAAVNRNKRSVALDLGSAEGRDAFRSLAATADVIVENHPPGRMERFGLDYESIREVNEAVIYCSITGFGQTGPYRELPALDIVVQALSGVMSLTGPPDGEPYRAGVPIGDLAGSMYAVQGILAALYDRRTTGEGEHLDVSMLDCTISWLTVRAGYTFGTGDPYPRLGNELREYVPYGVFGTADGPLALAVVTDDQWASLCAAIGRPELAADDRFATAAARREHRDEVAALLEEELARRSSREWFDRLADARIPAAPVNDTAEVWDDPHVESRGVRGAIDADGTPVDVLRYPVRFGGDAPGVSRGPPDLGEYTRAALEAAGYPDAAIDGIVGAIERYDPESG